MGGCGGRNSVPSNPNDGGTNKGNEQRRERVPYSKPPFTLSQLRKSIPLHCFHRSLLHSFSYLLFDLIIVAALFVLSVTTNHHSILTPIYWCAQGCALMSVWVIAHECGHHSFSEHQWIDDMVGFILHSALLVPYFSWKFSHRRHHSNTGSIDGDEAFVPKLKFSIPWYSKYLTNTIPGRSFSILVILTLGWPLYLAFNVSGRKYERFACHFDPYSPIYSSRERIYIIISDAGVIATAYLLYRISTTWGFGGVARVYGVPLLIANAFLVLITYLQHTHLALPHYDSSEWDWLRGAMSTVDRDYGVLNKVFHDLTDTHVAHHLFPTVPHYHAMEATAAIKPILGEYYRFDGTPIYKAIWRVAKECVYVETDHEDGGNKGVLWYRANAMFS